ncbi:MAG TPA: BlaI/MecI/CopY family transcriptional regulator [Armatimonadota bacterium]|nr:BlaI/MecI/CopY family transcriptional regulator [Armatimonadota bacterium]
MEGREKIGRAQLDVLRYIQDHAPATVRQVADHLAETRGLTRTTALNVMERLREKGYLVREPVEGVFHYSPAQPKPQFMRDLVRDFVNGALGGSLEPFVAYLAEEVQLSEPELERLRQRVRELEDAPGEGKP